MKKIAILGAGTVGGSCAQILLRDAAVLEKNAGEALELAYVVDLRDMPDAPFHDKMVKDFAVVEADPEVFLVIEAIGGCGAALNFVRRSLEAGKHVVTSNKQLVAERDRGKAILLVSLELDEVMSLSDRILVMYEGEIVGELDPKKTTVEELGLYMAGAKRMAKEEAAV